MKINKTYQSLLEKSVSSMLSAIEIYNKPDFKYREETFAILAINSWELLFKSQILKLSKYNMRSIYVLENKKNKNGDKSKKLQTKLTRSKNPMTINLAEAIFRLRKLNINLSLNLVRSLTALTELRDNAIHFHNNTDIQKEIQELGFACIKNYMELIKKWETKVSLSQYNFYLMPLAYVDSNIEADSILTDEVKNYLNYLKKKVAESDDSDIDYSVAIGIDITFKKNATLEGIGMRYDKNGVPIKITEEDITKKYPLTYNELTKKCNSRYSDFKLNNEFHEIMRTLKLDSTYSHNRKLDPNNPKSTVKTFFNTNIFKELDNKYKKK